MRFPSDVLECLQDIAKSLRKLAEIPEDEVSVPGAVPGPGPVETRSLSDDHKKRIKERSSLK